MIPFAEILIVIKWLLALYACSLLGVIIFIRQGSHYSILRYSVGKSLGVIGVAALIWVLSVLKIVPFSFWSLWLLIFILLAAVLMVKWRCIVDDISRNWRTYAFIELLFLLLFAAGIFLRATNPKLEGVEKFMDSAILSNLLRHQKGVPIDTWFAPNTMNYYYFGQWMIATVAKLSRNGANYAFNLGLATVLGLGGTSVFCLAWQLTRKRLAGILALFLAFFASNLQPVVALLGGQHNYFFYNSGRFTTELISEYPFYSIVLGDIHAHVLALIISTTLFGVVALLFLETTIFRDRLTLAIVAGCLVGLLVATSTFDVISGYLVFGLAVGSLRLYKKASTKTVIQLFGVFAIASILMSALFLLNFKPGVGGIALSIMKIPLKYVFWQFGLPVILGIGSYVVLSRQKKLALKDNIRLAVIFGIAGLILIVLPELVLLKDIYYYQNPPYASTNSVFKIWYDAWPLVAVSAASLATFAIYRLKKIWQLVMFSTVIIICGLLAVGTRYGFGVLKDGEAASIDGYSYLRTADPAKLAVINWANHNIKGQPIVVQAPGDSYSTNSWFSSYTGLPSPMGWTEHEWTWRYSANEWSIITARTAIITNLYDADSPAYLKQQASLLKADYILLGPDELSVYEVHRNVFNNAFGQPLYNNASYAIYKVD